MLDACSKYYRITTSKTDLYFNRGFKYADTAAKLARLLKKLAAENVEVYCVEAKTEALDGTIRYAKMHEVDLAATLANA